MQMTLYLPGTSYLHRFDPRVKLVLLVFFLTYIFLPVPIALHGGLLLLLVMVTATSLGVRMVFTPIIAVWPILVLIAVLTPPFYLQDPFLITGRLLLRFTSISYLFSLFFRTTEMSTVILTLRWFRLPYNAALVITMSLRFIPYLGGVYRQVQDAHRLRMGADSSTNRFSHRLASLIPSLTSVMIYSIRTIPELSMSLEHRGFGASGLRKKRRAYKSLNNDRKLFTHLVISVMIAVIFLVLPGIFA